MTAGSGTRVTLLGFTVPDEVLADATARDVVHATQTHTFAWALVTALRASGCQVRLLSAAPVSTWPRNRRVLFHGGPFDHDGVKGRLLGFVNLLGLKHMTRYLAARRRLAGELDEEEVLLVHGVHAPFLWAGALLARRRVRVVPVLTDPPGVVLPDDGWLVRLLRRVDVVLVRAALRRCTGVIALTGPLAEDFAPGRPRLVMEGIFHPATGVGSRVDIASGVREVVYAGGLSRAYGVDRLVDAFRALPDPDLRLRLFGRGELTPWLREQATVDPRIAPPELLDRTVLADRLARAAVLVNPRPVEQGFVRYSFPSKTIEYLSAGVPVVSTRLPGIPADYLPHLVLAEPDTIDGLREALAHALALTAGEVARRGLAGREFLRLTRSPAAQGRRVKDFLDSLDGRPAAFETDHSAVSSVAGY
ncbi:glycosyltransferase [Micromonospora krabiensis]|uniref:Glycosyltransferase involved in cell wall bisynthesis n=1 Tax=Micromonospora krabiensis TaxID=307121 RepID=A0A1C3N2M8_9ACTN|nr:glycosyltransferase [Micromonospora krabiensis]SBV26811.1 Glycosyltransferase involved in cell wall bisynthesis [Micromonospora krabiensis]